MLKVFLWLIFQNKLQTGVALKKRKWKGSALCGMCGQPETVDHIFFSCILAKFVWACLREALGWERTPVSIQDMLQNWIPLGCGDYSFKVFLLAVIFWVLWTSRNKRAIEGKFPKRPSELLFNINFFMQKWRVLLKGDEQDKLSILEGQLRAWVEPFVEKLRDRPPNEDFM
jgi:hypothetical protein